MSKADLLEPISGLSVDPTTEAPSMQQVDPGAAGIDQTELDALKEAHGHKVVEKALERGWTPEQGDPVEFFTSTADRLDKHFEQRMDALTNLAKGVMRAEAEVERIEARSDPGNFSEPQPDAGRAEDEKVTQAFLERHGFLTMPMDRRDLADVAFTNDRIAELTAKHPRASVRSIVTQVEAELNRRRGDVSTNAEPRGRYLSGAGASNVAYEAPDGLRPADLTAAERAAGNMLVEKGHFPSLQAYADAVYEDRLERTLEMSDPNQKRWVAMRG